ncbi:Protein POF1B [Dissostichus eleginoides]|uniref:Protein POF1B n=1 Tax=Dissostichus eleginoides TaxID=100907 RepID=A0AAD9BIP1_DISEL|nr:Protein POF1B [Dissostichus eleginoides]
MEIINVVRLAPPVIKTVRTEVREMPTETKMDTRYFGELLAEVYRKNCDIHSCISEHVSKIRGQKHHLDPSNDYKVEKEEVEALLPKGASELTRQQIRYLLQSMRLLLSTFSSLREELLHMTEDMMRLESEKEGLERDLSFKSDQARQYDSLLEAVRDNNRQLQLSLKETSYTQRSLESQLMSTKSSDSSPGGAGEQLHPAHQLSAMRDEKDQEIQRLRSQVTRIQTEVTTTTSERSSADNSLQLKISELLAMLELRQTTISKQEEEIRRMRMEMTSMTSSSSNSSNSSSSRNLVTKTTTTKSNKYPMLGLLDDQYQSSSVKTNKTIVLERTT